MRYSDKTCRPTRSLDILVSDFVLPKTRDFLFTEKIIKDDMEDKWIHLSPLIPEKPIDFLNYTRKLSQKLKIFFAKCTAQTIPIECSSSSFMRHFNSVN